MVWFEETKRRNLRLACGVCGTTGNRVPAGGRGGGAVAAKHPHRTSPKRGWIEVLDFVREWARGASQCSQAVEGSPLEFDNADHVPPHYAASYRFSFVTFYIFNFVATSLVCWLAPVFARVLIAVYFIAKPPCRICNAYLCRVVCDHSSSRVRLSRRHRHGHWLCWM